VEEFEVAIGAAATHTPSGASLKKTDSEPKKTRQRRSSEEDGPARKCTFTPDELRQFRVGGHNVRKVVATEEIQQALKKRGIEPQTSSPSEFNTFVQADLAKWSKIVKDANIKPE